MQKIIGVSLTDSALEASLIGYSFRMLKPLKVFSISLPSSKEEKNAVLLETFKTWKQEYAPAGITIGLPLKYFLCQSIEMPLMKKKDMQKALAFELEKYLPLTVDEYSFDFLGLPPEGKRQRTVILAIKKEIIQSLAAIAGEAGLSLRSITCNTLCAYSGIQEIAGEKNMQGIFVQAVDEGYETACLKGSQPVQLRYVPKGHSANDEIGSLASLCPGKVYCTGNIDQRLTDAWSARKFQISVAHAVAASSLKKIPFMLDFLPQEYASPKKDYYPFVLGGIAAASVLLFLLGGVIRYYKDFSTLRSIESRIASIKQKASPIIEIQKKLDALQNDRSVLSDFQQKSNMAIKVLSQLSNLLPKDAWIVNLSVDDKGKIELEGFASKTTRLVIELENSAAFKNVTFSSPVIAKDGEERFSIKMEVEGI